MIDVDALLRFLKGAVGLDLGPEPIAAFDTRLIFEAALALPQWMAFILLVIGLALAGFGSRGMFKRLMIGIAGGLAGFFLVGTLPWISASQTSSWVAAIAVGLAGLLWPPLGSAALGMLLGSWVVAAISHDSSGLVMKQLSTGLIVALIFATSSRWLAAIFSSLVGAVVTVIAAIGLLPAELQQTLAMYPAAPLLPMVVIACSGGAYQLARSKAPPPKPEDEGGRDSLSSNWSPN